jgi:hypothetical protein
MSLGNEGRIARYACSRIRYCGGIILRASSSEMGKIASVPFKVPVALLGYSEAMGLGRSRVWHVFVSSTGPPVAAGAAGAERYVVPTYRRATTERSVMMKYWSRDSVILEADILLPERTWFIIFSSRLRSTKSYTHSLSRHKGNRTLNKNTRRAKSDNGSKQVDTRRKSPPVHDHRIPTAERIMPRHANIPLAHFTRQVLPPWKPTRVVQACGRFVLLVPWKLEFPNADRKTWQTLIRASSAAIVREKLETVV